MKRALKRRVAQHGTETWKNCVSAPSFHELKFLCKQKRFSYFYLCTNPREGELRLTGVAHQEHAYISGKLKVSVCNR